MHTQALDNRSLQTKTALASHHGDQVI